MAPNDPVSPPIGDKPWDQDPGSKNSIPVAITVSW